MYTFMQAISVCLFLPGSTWTGAARIQKN